MNQRTLERIARTTVLVIVTIVGVEWIHSRLGEPTLLDLVWSARGPASTASIGHDRTAVSEADFERYVQVLESMQADHALTVDDAAQSANLTLDRFRSIEAAVQRDPLLVERTRELLRKKAEDLWNERSPLERG